MSAMPSPDDTQTAIDTLAHSKIIAGSAPAMAVGFGVGFLYYVSKALTIKTLKEAVRFIFIQTVNGLVVGYSLYLLTPYLLGYFGVSYHDDPRISQLLTIGGFIFGARIIEGVSAWIKNVSRKDL